jgi:RimJ/RimL family protein N-acetyltransferase
VSAGPDFGIRGERVTLVPIDRERHLECFVRWLNDPEVTRYTIRHGPLARLQEERWFEKTLADPDAIVWAVHDENDRPIGVTGVHRVDWRQRSALTGTVLGEASARGRGYGHDTMLTRTRWLFEELGLHRLESECFEENAASRHCLEKVGYHLIGRAPQDVPPRCVAGLVALRHARGGLVRRAAREPGHSLSDGYPPHACRSERNRTPNSSCAGRGSPVPSAMKISAM